ncbi:acyl transferase/acyl hydrolase/lysophospholipase [Schizophyllum amplum]|uniref:Acyl transferase/acyl hydrolase/lysophospholipase n=1 Tax=Schizophyllum amplum TaxID=97359 RepID=A0A550CQ72_9AGAR|nr:acyl transferase/acyl hydrolase/lysophospholipase [Auriculariopsis ampla]
MAPDVCFVADDHAERPQHSTGPSKQALPFKSALRKTTSYYDPVVDIWGAMPVSRPGVRLLALDDGGTRGLAMLIMLRDILQAYQHRQHLDYLPRPCEYFDIIAGSGTGGFIALLLGRLYLTIDQAFLCYTRVIEDVFSQKKSSGAYYKTTPLEAIVNHIACLFGQGEKTPILEKYNSSSCKTFVCIRQRDDSGNAVHCKLRTYINPTEPFVECTLPQAMRGTLGHPKFFKPLVISENKTYIDAGDDHYNPVFDIFEEALTLYPSHRFAYFLSLGLEISNTGKPPTGWFSATPIPLPFLDAHRHIADNCKRIATEFEEENGSECDGNYFRIAIPDQPSFRGFVQPEQEERVKKFTDPFSKSYGARIAWMRCLWRYAKRRSVPSRERAACQTGHLGIGTSTQVGRQSQHRSALGYLSA